ncbi:GNAT family N-acetyltransferase [Patescibacteria group bacterium]|nr:GNAT family N-acetyltransferase [Patescibacteria group bacterium]MBU1472888.1 GNAT family N-acetyltransferase [Patescibacteria group bacterium]MBU2459789.1 GNAT family N-acetyltransferase [Patescibacteria group bacterium]MBU2544810.1 GNAT family N-acetyltransferase [Patescibacteria group bacterium]
MEFGKIIKTFKSKNGNIVVFRYPRENDLDDMLSFANDLIDEDTYVLLSGKKLTRNEEKKHLHTTLKDIKNKQELHIVVEVNGAYAGNARVKKKTLRKSHVGEVGIAIGHRYRGDGVGTELLRTLIKEAKKQELRLLTLTCFENNSQAFHLYEKLGFKSIGVIPEALLYKGNYIGEAVLYLSLVEVKKTVQ